MNPLITFSVSNLGLTILITVQVFIGQIHAQSASGAQPLYLKHCASCHGQDLNGGMAQSLTDKVWLFGAEDHYVYRNIKFGIQHRGMPSYQHALTDEEIRQIMGLIFSSEDRAGAEKPLLPERIETRDYHIRIEVWAEGLTVPWGLAFASDRLAWVTERPGRLREIRDGRLDPVPVQGTPEVLNEGQGGLLDVAVDPEYAQNGWIYLSYSHAINSGSDGERPRAMTRIVRGRIRDHTWTDPQVVYEADPEFYTDTRHHYGSRIVFDPQGLLYFSVGDRGARPQAQDLSRPNGKIHRIHPDGTVPEDNPFIGRTDVLPSLFTYGNRNVQGLAVHPETGQVWASEHGPMGGDELNVLKPGINYGWPEITYGRNYNGAVISEFRKKHGMAQPTLYWNPSIAVCGIDFYTGSQFPLWQNHLIAGALKYEEVRILNVETERVLHQQVILKNAGRVRDVACGPDGAIYVVLNRPGTILRLTREDQDPG